jgi:hypothetical protein
MPRCRLGAISGLLHCESVSIIPEAAVTVIAILAARGNRMGQRLVVFVLELTD